MISTYHNAFERTHRFAGWLGLGVCTPFPHTPRKAEFTEKFADV